MREPASTGLGFWSGMYPWLWTRVPQPHGEAHNPHAALFIHGVMGWERRWGGRTAIRQGRKQAKKQNTDWSKESSNKEAATEKEQEPEREESSHWVREKQLWTPGREGCR